MKPLFGLEWSQVDLSQSVWMLESNVRKKIYSTGLSEKSDLIELMETLITSKLKDDLKV